MRYQNPEYRNATDPENHAPIFFVLFDHFCSITHITFHMIPCSHVSHCLEHCFCMSFFLPKKPFAPQKEPWLYRTVFSFIFGFITMLLLFMVKRVTCHFRKRDFFVIRSCTWPAYNIFRIEINSSYRPVRPTSALFFSSRRKRMEMTTDLDVSSRVMSNVTLPGEKRVACPYLMTSSTGTTVYKTG